MKYSPFWIYSADLEAKRVSENVTPGLAGVRQMLATADRPVQANGRGNSFPDENRDLAAAYERGGGTKIRGKEIGATFSSAYKELSSVCLSYLKLQQQISTQNIQDIILKNLNG